MAQHQTSKVNVKHALSKLKELQREIEHARKQLSSSKHSTALRGDVVPQATNTIQTIIVELQKLLSDPVIRDILGAIPTIGPILSVLTNLINIIPTNNLPDLHGVFDGVFGRLEGWVQEAMGKLQAHA